MATAPAAIHAARFSRLRALLREEGLDALIVLDRINTLYLTGFRCSYSVLVVDAEKALFVTDSRYGEAAEREVEHCRIHIQPTKGSKEFLAGLIGSQGYRRVGFEGSISVDQHDDLRDWCDGAVTQKAGELLRTLRLVKDETELASIRRAVAIADQMMERAAGWIAPGITEREISRRLRVAVEELGGERESFSNIVASGPNASRPHHHPGDRPLAEGDVVTVDLGAVFEGYCSDLTRNFFLGNPDPRLEEIYYVCREANEKAIAAIRPGMTGPEVDAVAREVIAAAGYGEYFGHGLGHGVGLEIHESPRLSPAGGRYLLQEGNIVTIEPGIYLPGVGGVRIEDYVLLNEDGAEVLSRFPKDMRIIPV